MLNGIVDRVWIIAESISALIGGYNRYWLIERESIGTILAPIIPSHFQVVLSGFLLPTMFLSIYIIIHAKTIIEGEITKSLLSSMLLIATIGMCVGDIQCPPGSVYYTVSVPEGWNIAGFGCCGIAASDSASPATGIIALNHLHEGFDMLPAYTTPETYLENYMPHDFSLGDKKVTDMRILGYEDNQDLANAFASYTGLLASGKSMRCSFAVDGIQSIGSFTIVTSELMGYGTTVNFLGGIHAPADQFEMEVSKLIDIFKSIQLIPNYRNICTPPEACLSWQYSCRDKCCSEPCNENGYCD